MTATLVTLLLALGAGQATSRPLASPPSAAPPRPAVPGSPAQLPATNRNSDALPASATSTSNWSGPQSATAAAARSEVRLGEPFEVTIEIRHAPGETWTLKAGQKLDPFKLRVGEEAATAPSATAASGATKSATTGSARPAATAVHDTPELTHLLLELALFQLGPHQIPDLALVASKPGEAPHEFSLPGPVVKGITAPGGDRERRDIRGPVALQVTSYRNLLYILAGLAGLLALALAVRAWQRRPRREAVVVTPVVPADQVALQGLATLEAEGLPGRGRFKEFHLQLSELLRRYLAERYSMHALDMTSGELYASLSRLPTEGLSFEDLRWVLSEGDLAKFAKGAPTIDDCKRSLQIVRQTVLRTRRAEVAAGAAGATERRSA